MRVIAGSAKGRKLRTLAGLTTRPTPARVREALFSMLQGLMPITEAVVLDLFAGSGALGIEALSRGATHATFVDCDRHALAVLRNNVAPFGPRASVCAMPAACALTRLARRQFSLVFLDPPFQKAMLAPTLLALVRGNLVTTGGAVVCEHHTKSPQPEPPAGLAVVKQRQFGDVSITVMLALPQGCPP